MDFTSTVMNVSDQSSGFFTENSKICDDATVSGDVKETNTAITAEIEDVPMTTIDARCIEAHAPKASNSDDELAVSSTVAAILAKLSDPETELDIRERSVSRGVLSQNSNPDNSSTIAAILEKLNDPQRKLNRRERRALQRELEMAQGIHKAYPISQTYPCQSNPSSFGNSSLCCLLHEAVDEHDALMTNLPTSHKASYNCVSSSSLEDSIAVQRNSKIQETVRMISESVFKLDNVSMTPHDCAVTAFDCERISYVSTAIPINNFLKLCRFSPSGTYIGTTSADNSARIFRLDDEHNLSLVVKIPLGDATYDIKWLSNVSGKQFLATTAKHHPIHLWTENGTRCASYRGINHLDELTGAYSVAFSNDGSRLYAGYNSCIRIWDTDRPGRQHSSIKTWDKQTGGQKSIISCIAMNKVFNGVYATGAYDGNVGFYSDRTNSLECMFSTESAGITDMHYSCDGQRLFVATRKTNEISCYDMRMPGNVLFKMLRHFTTNQRACFEVDSAGNYLFSGSSDGDLVVFDLASDLTEKMPVLSRKVADCAVPCVSIHEGNPPLVALCTGERVFPSPCLGSTSSSNSDSDDDKTSYRRRCFSEQLNNSLQLWCF